MLLNGRSCFYVIVQTRDQEVFAGLVKEKGRIGKSSIGLPLRVTLELVEEFGNG